MTKKPFRLHDQMIGIIGVLACLVLGKNIIGTSFQTKAFPMALLVILFGLSLALIFRRKKQDGYELKEFRRIVVTFLLIAAYIFLIQIVGFLVMTIAFCMGFMLYHKPDMNKLVMLGFGIGYPLIIYFLFHNLLAVRLPSGLLI